MSELYGNFFNIGLNGLTTKQLNDLNDETPDSRPLTMTQDFVMSFIFHFSCFLLRKEQGLGETLKRLLAGETAVPRLLA